MLTKKGVEQEVIIWLIIAALSIAIGIALYVVFSGKIPGFLGGAFQ